MRENSDVNLQNKFLAPSSNSFLDWKRWEVERLKKIIGQTSQFSLNSQQQAVNRAEAGNKELYGLFFSVLFDEVNTASIVIKYLLNAT